MFGGILMSYRFLLDIAIILISTKVFGLITNKFHMPQVVGALLAGLVFGPCLLNVISQTSVLSSLSEMGVIVIMFAAGMTTDIKDLKNAGKSGFLVALLGVIVPLIGGTLVGFLFNIGGSDKSAILSHVFLGVILTATSVSITVEALKEMGKLSTNVGNTILAAAIIDDFLGLIALTVVTSLAGVKVNIFLVILKIILFFVFVTVVYLIFPKLFNKYTEHKQSKNLHRYPIAAFVLCLLFAFVAEEIFGVADIIGAFSAGLIIAATKKAEYISAKFEPVQYMFLTPIFFASIGLKVTIPSMSIGLILFAVVFTLTAILGKIIGCGIGARLSGYNNKEALQVGCGMACRGEVALIVANKGLSLGIIGSSLFGPIVIMVVCCAVLTPIMLKAAFKNSKEVPQQSDIVDKIEGKEQLDIISDNLIEQNKNLQNKN